MLPTATVENYLKAIYLGTAGTTSSRLLPMGQLASALGVAPGTATTMVKTLAEAGLVDYQPYTGVSLTAAGERLAALVLRRHRLIELFLVRVMGYAWDEVHDEAEQLEHVVSERLIDRIDEMLGRPETDPHGDPIPNAEGLVKPQHAQSLLTCPLNTPVRVTRVIDQDRAFLRFIEGHDLKPGESIEVEARDAASDSVRVRGKNDQRITIGTRAASKLLVQVGAALIVLATLAGGASAQDQSRTAQPFAITDNSMLVEEAFNQEAGVVQNILQPVRSQNGEWVTTFTQEWPLISHTHQLSYSIAYQDFGGVSGLADTQVHYRLQVRDETARGPALSPRISLFLPTGDSSRGLGEGGPAWQLNLPLSKQFGDFYVHGNAGVTQSPRAKALGREWNLFAMHGGGSVIWRARPMLNLMLESVIQSIEQVENVGTRRDNVITISPGLRGGWNIGESQLVLAAGVPITREPGETTTALVTYVSYEFPFRHSR
jgi:DtxR family transcriptional regulator, Mn-dependent transcriptional regulator